MESTQIERELPIGEQGEIVIKNPAVFKGLLEATRSNPKHPDRRLALYRRYRPVRRGRIPVSIGPQKGNDQGLRLFRFPRGSGTDAQQTPRSGPIRGDRRARSQKRRSGQSLYRAPGPDNNQTVESIKAWARENMSAYKCPAHIEFRTELPTLGTGKLLRRALKES